MRLKPTISVVGAGNLGYHLAMALHGAGFRLINIISRTPEKAIELAEHTGAKATTRISERDPEPDIFLVCVSDDQIPEVSSQLTETEALVAHTAGSVGMDVLAEHGDRAGVLYPLQTFTRQIPMDYGNIPFMLEAGSEQTLQLLVQLADGISGRYMVLDSESRMQVHVAAVFACNFSNHMSAIAEQLLHDRDLEFSILRPLVEQTMLKIDSASPRDAQTGPAARNDRGTLESHLAMLQDKHEIHELYRLISENIYRTSKNDHSNR